MKFWAQASINLGADGASLYVAGDDAEDHDLTYVIGAEIGFKNVKFGAKFAHVESDSLYPLLIDDDYNSSLTKTDIEALIIYAKYNIYSNLELSAKYYDSETIDGVDGEGETLQVNLLYKFWLSRKINIIQ